MIRAGAGAEKNIKSAMGNKTTLVVGICGQPSSGKDTLANYLSEKGFKHFGTGDILREEMDAMGIATTRSNMRDFVIKRRKERGAGYLAQIAAKKVTGNSVISGLRNTKEVDALKNKFGENFFLIAVEAPIQLRYEWAKARGRISDKISFRQFKAEEDAERRGNPETHEVDNVIKMADYVINNSGTEAELLVKIDSVIAELSSRHKSHA